MDQMLQFIPKTAQIPAQIPAPPLALRNSHLNPDQLMLVHSLVESVAAAAAATTEAAAAAAAAAVLFADHRHGRTAVAGAAAEAAAGAAAHNFIHHDA